MGGNMNKTISLKSKYRGLALPLVMCVVLILSILGVGLLALGYQTRLQAIKNASTIAARFAADAGLTKAMYDMNTKLQTTPWDDSTLPSASNITLPGSSLTYSYTVAKNGSSYVVTATGSSGTAQKQVSCTLVGQGGPFQFALFGNENVSLTNSSTVDQYNTTAGTPPLQVGTNSTTAAAVSLTNSCTVNGNAIVGVGGNPATVIKAINSSKVTGSQSAATAPNTLTSVAVPASIASLPSQGALSLSNSASQTLNSSARYSSITISNSSTLKIDGAVSLYVTGNINISNTSQITVVKTNPNASLTIYIGGNLSIINSSNINNQTKDARKAQVLALDTSTSIGLGNSSDFYGCVYAPKAQVTLGNSCGTYGSAVANKVVGTNSCSMHYDASLANLSISTAGSAATGFTVKNWSDL